MRRCSAQALTGPALTFFRPIRSLSTVGAFRCMVAGVITFANLLATRAAAQSDPPRATTRIAPWAFISAVGYGGAGLAVGAAALTSSANGYAGDALTAAAFTGGGIVGGFIVGRHTGTNLRAGRPIGRWHQVGVVLGAVFAGGALGGLAAVPLINPDGDGTALGSDEATVVKTAAVGSGVGLLFALTQWRSLSKNTVAIAPYRDAQGSPGIRVRVPL